MRHLPLKPESCLAHPVGQSWSREGIVPEETVCTVQKHGHIALLAIDNPPVNALSLRTLAALDLALDAVEASEEAKVVIITGVGQKAFVGGADIRELDAARGVDGGRELTERGQALFNRVAGFRAPVIAAINGVAFGGGLELALACHLRICSDSALMGQTEINLGIMPGWGGTQRLPRLIGPARALALILTGDRVDALEAHRIGLVHRVVPAEALMDEALALGERIVEKSAPAVASALRALVDGLEMPLDAALRHEADLFVALMGTAGAAEGFRAFFEKRPPRFTDS
jgi:enoyl-CoA hydratase